MTDSAGNVTDTYTYDAWGNVNQNGSTSQPYQFVGQLGYYTHYQEPEFGLMQLGVRFYDAAVGRFTQRDPVRDGINWYEYAGNGPVVQTDPKGMFVDIPIRVQCLCNGLARAMELGLYPVVRVLC